jgi:hypothetical protein
MRLVFPIKEKVEPNRMRGLGDLVAKVAEPIKRTIIKHGPRTLANKLATGNCGCNKRKEMLNRMVPFGK